MSVELWYDLRSRYLDAVHAVAVGEVDGRVSLVFCYDCLKAYVYFVYLDCPWVAIEQGLWDGYVTVPCCVLGS